MRLKLAGCLRFRPRFLTLVLLIIVAATIMLANLSFDFGDLGLFPSGWLIIRHKSYGWPLIWHRYVFFESAASTIKTVGWYYSPARLAANLAVWLLIVVASAVASEWRLRRHPPRLRWNLRAMLAAVALAAALCAWFAAARDRANLQEPLIATITARGGHVFFERWGPKWLDLFGADPFRRRIIGVDLKTWTSTSVDEGVAEAEDAAEADFLKRLSRLPDLQYLILDANSPNPEIAAALVEMRRLRVLSIVLQNSAADDPEEQWFSDHCLAAIGEMTQLEELHLHGMGIDSRQLSRLGPLSKLRFLSLEFLANSYGPDFATVRLDQLPPLPQLEAIDLTGTDFSDRDLRHLASFPQLRKLNLSCTEFTDAQMADLASLASLEELAIDMLPSSPSWLESLLALKCLHRLHIPRYFRSNDTQAKLPIDTEQATTYTGMAGGDDPRVKLSLADGGEIFVPEADLEDCRRAFAALRQSNSRMIIDADEHALSWFRRGYQLLREHDTEANRRADWLPTSGYPWIAPAMRTQFEAYAEEHGVRMSF